MTDPNHILGSDPFDIEDLVRAQFRNDYRGAGEIAMRGSARVEMACWDIMGKALNQPVYRLLGGAVRDKIKAYANGWYTVERRPEAFQAAAKRVVAKGYGRSSSIRSASASTRSIAQSKLRSVGLVEAVRDAVGPDVEIWSRCMAASIGDRR